MRVLRLAALAGFAVDTVQPSSASGLRSVLLTLGPPPDDNGRGLPPRSEINNDDPTHLVFYATGTLWSSHPYEYLYNPPHKSQTTWARNWQTPALASWLCGYESQHVARKGLGAARGLKNPKQRGPPLQLLMFIATLRPLATCGPWPCLSSSSVTATLGRGNGWPECLTLKSG
ncbi:uncharacterized protein LY79DRAFT_301723 [Colletotrichum navitas]|uniref:Uncharacterized protein n=1 Tax=Colletotrichum navitas TaxID=681940 RepID=A0AAD8PUI7_9PEZI|nr:uncharacterized protein LY79DRAFT_301723 [Colletotrichum navitas]KAK1580485.1 hypothetical protein LY79DRAFT_301723 [Colletotrichum navitas]